MADKGSENREWKRITWTTPIHVIDSRTGKELPMEGRVRDLSKTGFAMVYEEELKRRVSYDFIINRKVNPIYVRGKVVHIQNEGTYFIIGVRLESLSLIEKSRFNRFLSNYSEQMKKVTFLYSLIGGIGVALAFHYIFGATPGMSFLIFLVTSIFLKLFAPF